MINLSVSQQVMRPQERRLLRQQRLPEPATGWQHAGTWALLRMKLRVHRSNAQSFERTGTYEPHAAQGKTHVFE